MIYHTLCRGARPYVWDPKETDRLVRAKEAERLKLTFYSPTRKVCDGSEYQTRGACLFLTASGWSILWTDNECGTHMHAAHHTPTYMWYSYLTVY